MFSKNNDPLEKANEEAAAHIKQEEEAEATLQRDLVDAKKRDAEEKIAARSFRPNVRIVKYDAGEFLCYDGHEIPRAFIEGIEVGDIGGAPRFMHTGYGGSPYVQALRASVKITKPSGQVALIDCSRHELDILFDALVKAWKGQPNGTT